MEMVLSHMAGGKTTEEIQDIVGLCLVLILKQEYQLHTKMVMVL